MKSFAFGLLAILLSSGAGLAKPLLTDSQDSYVSACLRDDDSLERMAAICTAALDQAGASRGQRMELLDTLGWTQVDLGQTERAEQSFQAILDLDPGSDMGHRGMGWVAYLRDDYATAATHYQRSIDRRPTGDALATLGASLFRSDQIGLERFHSYLDTALALDPDNRWILREKGWTHVDHDDPALALPYFRRALDVYAEDANARYGLASALSDLDRNEEALPHINAAIEEVPDRMRHVRLRALILLRLDRPRQALKDADRMIADWPARADGYVYRARAQNALGRRGVAIDELAQAATDLDPTAFLIYWRAWYLYLENEYAAALDLIRQSVDLPGRDSSDDRLHARIALGAGALEEAQTMIDQALQAEPNSRWSLYYKSLIQVAAQAFDAGEASFDQARAQGLPARYLPDFLAALVAEGQFLQAINMRVRHADQARAQGE